MWAGRADGIIVVRIVGAGGIGLAGRVSLGRGG